MAQTTAERQAAYHARRVTAGDDGNGDRRLSMWVTAEADLAQARSKASARAARPMPR